MARIRTIKPDFWTDEKIVELDMPARLFFIGCWNFADDNGNLQRSAKKLKMQVFPADAIDCEPLIQSLMTHGLLTEYEVNGEKFLHINGFKKHQVINRPSKTGLPTPDSVSNADTLTEDSLTEGKGREKEGKGIKPSAQAYVVAESPREPVEPQSAAAEISSTLIAWERARGKVPRGISASNAQVMDLAAQKPTSEELRKAYDLAVADREATGDAAPINAGFVLALLAKVRSPPRQRMPSPSDARAQERADVIATLTGRKPANERTPETLDVAARRID